MGLEQAGHVPAEDSSAGILGLTFKSDHQGHLEFQLPAGFGDPIGNDGTVDNSTKDIDEDSFHLKCQTERSHQNSGRAVSNQLVK